MAKNLAAKFIAANDPASVMNQDWPTVVDAKDYLEKHKIPRLFINLTSLLVLRQPRDPKEFLVRQIRTLAGDSFFDETDLHTMYNEMVLERKGCNHMTLSQFISAMEMLGLTEFSTKPAGFQMDCITKDNFIRNGLKELKNEWETRRAESEIGEHDSDPAKQEAEQERVQSECKDKLGVDWFLTDNPTCGGTRKSKGDLNQFGVDYFLEDHSNCALGTQEELGVDWFLDDHSNCALETKYDSETRMNDEAARGPVYEPDNLDWNH